MEKFFKVKKKENSKLYNLYFDYINMSNKINNFYKEFSKENNIESSQYYQNTNRLCFIPTEKDKETFKDMFVANSDTDLKKTSKLCKDWIKLCKENSLSIPRKPRILWDCNVELHSCNASERLFHIGNKLYGSVDNKCDENFDLTDEFIELKASEFYKIIEDEENKEEN